MSIAADQLGLAEYDGALFEGSDCFGDCEGPFVDLSSDLEEAKESPAVAPVSALSMAPTAGKVNPLVTAPSVSGYHMPEAQSLVPAHVIVLGSGLAGLSAAIEALEAGAFVTLIEKTKQIGGNSAKATSGINGVKTRAQAVKKVNDTIPLFERDTLVSAGPSADPTLVHTLATHSAEALDWLENFGLDLSEVVQIGGHSVPRTHREPVDPTKRSAAAVGWDIIQTLVNHLKKQSPQQLHIILNAYAEKLVTRKMAATGAVGAKTTDSVAVPPAGKVHNYDMLEEVCGVEYRDATGQLQRVTGDAVVLATGGFAADAKSADSLLRKHAPQLLHLATTNGEWAQGEGIKMAMRLSDNLRPALVDMEHVQVHPTGFVDPKNPMATPKVLGPESLRGYGGLLLDINGKRFCNELGLRDYVSNEIFKHGFRYSPNGKLAQSAAAAPPSPTAAPVDEKQLPVCAYLIMNDEAVERFGRPAFDFYANKRGLFRSFANASAMAAALGMEPSVLSDTLAHYVASVHMGKDEFGKRVFPTVLREDAPIHVCLVTPCLHYTMGGLKINSASEVQSERGVHFESSTSLPGLFAAGEVAGGLHGRNRLGGNSLLGCAVFGRIAGRRAAAINQSHLQVLRKDRFTALPLREKWLVGRNTRIYRFQLPSSKQALGYGACQYIAVRAKINGKNEVRYYSPISRYDDMGHLDLLIKADDVARGAGTSMAAIVDNLQPGQTLEFAGPFGDLHLDLALSKPGQWLGNRTGLRPIKKIGMIAGGVGLSPMLQILRSIFHHNREDIQLILLYGAEVEEELVLRDRILAMEKQHPNFKAVFTLHYPPSEEQQKHAGIKYHQGFITGEFIQQHMFAPASDLKIVICGPYKMCQAMKENLENVGYHKSMYYSFM